VSFRLLSNSLPFLPFLTQFSPPSYSHYLYIFFNILNPSLPWSSCNSSTYWLQTFHCTCLLFGLGFCDAFGFFGCCNQFIYQLVFEFLRWKCLRPPEFGAVTPKHVVV
jgi:hypothetical protein